jgi:hypothetical protein
MTTGIPVGRRGRDAAPDHSRTVARPGLEFDAIQQPREDDLHLEGRERHAEAAPHAAAEREV